MEYLPDDRLCFLHVPKNAGKSVRAALGALGPVDHGPLAADLGVTLAEVPDAIQGAWTHPDLGEIHPAHIPLAPMRDHFPQSWAAFEGSHAFCLTRAPRDRFFSALLQRMREFGGHGALRAGDPVVRDEAARVCDHLAGVEGVLTEAQYIHFGRQVDFADLDGTRRVEAVFPMGNGAAVEAWLQKITGKQTAVTETHVRRQPKPWAKGVQPVARFVGRTLMPRTVKRALHPLWTRSPVFDDARGSYANVDLGDTVETFIRDYYAADAALHAEAQAAAKVQA